MDIWKEAQEFLNEFLPDNIEERFIEYIKEKKLNRNEAQLFKTYCGKYLSFNGTTAILKMDCDEYFDEILLNIVGIPSEQERAFFSWLNSFGIWWTQKGSNLDNITIHKKDLETILNTWDECKIAE